MGKYLVIVESPTKAKTITRFLGDDFDILASYGHVRDLPNSASEIPAKVKKEKWTRLGVDIKNGFSPLYIIPPGKIKYVKALKTALKGASELLLATDEDREGESISWHLLEVLKPKIPVKRLVFHEITKTAIDKSLSSPREVDESLVKAQETRRIIDRLYGYLVSPLLWKKMAPGLSAGRVQSVAMRLLVERERERIAFKSGDYWDLKGILKTGTNASFEAELSHVDGKRVASGKDFDPASGKLKEDSGAVLLLKGDALKLKDELLAVTPTVESVDEKPYSSRPYAPFVTSTLQQEASRKLRYSAKRTMGVAQNLYENGFITYMRTDSTVLSEEALSGARSVIAREFGEEYLHPSVREYKTRVKNAQEAHEAIRPAGADFAAPAEVKAKLGPDAFRLYELIWKRTLASQMKDAEGTRIAVQIKAGRALFRASGKTIKFAGYLRAYVEGSDDPEAELADQEKILPKLSKGESLSFRQIEALGHSTQPPARYTEGSLIKELERRGIGRPSTWASIVDVILARKYAFRKGTSLVPSFKAMAVTNLMEEYFASLLDYDFTARMEDDLDAIARGEAESLNYLQSFYFGNGFAGLKQMVEEGEEKIDPRIVCGLPLGTSPEGRAVEIRIGRYGPFLSDGETRASIPDVLPPDELTIEKGCDLLKEAAAGPKSLGTHPDSDEPVYLKNGRYGYYLQLGDQGEGKEKPKMASLLPGMEPADVDLETAVKILSLPRVLGVHPENKKEITAASGPYGPYIKCGRDSRSLAESGISPFEITLDEALKIFSQPKKRGRREPKILRELGKHPVSELDLTIRVGRFGPYVTDGELNASLLKGMDPKEITVDDAVNLLEARAAKLAGQADVEGGGVKAKKTAAKKKTAVKKNSSAKKKSSEGKKGAKTGGKSRKRAVSKRKTAKAKEQ